MTFPTEGTTAVDSGQGQQETPTTTAPAEGGGGNPAWDELRSSLGDTTFTLIKPHLEKFDQAANQRITSLNQQLKGYSELGDVQTLQQYRALAQQLDSSPKDFYDRLQQALTERGLLEQAQAVKEQAEQLEDDDTDPRIAQLQAEQERIQEMLQQQELERLTAQQSNVLQQSIAATRQANAWMSDADEVQVVRMANAKILDGSANSIEQAMQHASAEYTEIRNRFLSTPRAGDSAPKLPGVGGGNTSNALPQDVSKATRGQTQDLVTAYLKAAQAG
jgi:DNA-binding protein H-NS